jgi:ABC-type thiamin/hydroxymethylpyrimidine transport system permease subunit
VILVPGAIAIVIVLLLIPVLVLISGGVLAGVIGQVLGRDADARHAGDELLELED